MSPKKIRAELPGSENKSVYVRGYYVSPHYRRLPRRQPPLVDPITEKEVGRLFTRAMLEQRCKENEQLRTRERERIRQALVELVALNKRLHAYRLTRGYSPIQHHRIHI